LKELNKIVSDIDKSWQGIVKEALLSLDKEYLNFLLKNRGYFPDIDNFLNAFKTLSLNNTRYILFGQDPYPRYESAIGYAFIDGKVKEIFSKNGLSREVNRATSLRNFIKMLLVCGEYLRNDISQRAIAKLDKSNFINNIYELKDNFEKNGILLLNSALIFTAKSESKYHLKMWKSFIEVILSAAKDREIKLILFGKAANDILKLKGARKLKSYIFQHPYNLTFITDKEVHKVFYSMNLLLKH